MTLEANAIYAANVNFDITKLPQSKKERWRRKLSLLRLHLFCFFYCEDDDNEGSKTGKWKKESYGYVQFSKRKQEEKIVSSTTSSKSLVWVTENIISGEPAKILCRINRGTIVKSILLWKSFLSKRKTNIILNAQLVIWRRRKQNDNADILYIR